MKNPIKKLLAFGSWLLVVGCWLLTLPLSAGAQETAGLRIEPALIEQNAQPGQTLTFTLRATNLEALEKTFYVVTRDIARFSDEVAGQPVFADPGEETSYAVSSWINLKEASVTIASGKTRDIPFTILVPNAATPGSHLGGIFLESQPVRPGETGMGVGYRVGAILNLRIAGAVLEEAQIREFRTDRGIYAKPEVVFTIRMENLGNVLLRPAGFLELTDFFGKKAVNLVVNESGAAILPHDIRQYTIFWNGAWYAFGRHQAVLSLVYGDDTRQTVTAALAFWVLPVRIIAPVLGGIAGLIVLVWAVIKLSIRRKLKEMGMTPGTRDTVASMAKHAPMSRLTLAVIALLIFAVVFLGVLFFLLA